MQAMHAYAPAAAAGMAPRLFTELPQMPGQAQQIQEVNAAANAPGVHPDDTAASKQQHVQLPPELMQQIVLVQGPYGIQAVPAAAYASIPQV